MLSTSEISIETINHLGLVAGIIDDIGIEEIINEVAVKFVPSYHFDLY